MATAPQYVGTPRSPTVTIATANINRDGTTGTYGTLYTAGASGGRVDVISINATGNTTAGMIRLFVGNSMIREVPVLGATPSATVQAWSHDLAFSPGLVLAAAAVLRASTQNGEPFNLTITNGGDF